MNAGTVLICFLIALIIMALLGEKDKTAGTWFMLAFMLFAMIGIIHEDVSQNNHKNEVVGRFMSMRPVYCQDGGKGSPKYIKLSMQDGWKYNKELERFESNSTIIEYRKSELCYIKDGE